MVNGSLTCNLVADEFARLEFSYGREQRPDFLLRHVLWQVVDDQVGLGLVVHLGLGRIRRPGPVLPDHAPVHSVHDSRHQDI